MLGKRSAEDACARKDQSPVDRETRADRSLYAQAVLPDETHLYSALPVGKVDDELRLCRLRLSRAATAEARLIASGESEGLIRIQDEINRITTTIDRLESRRAQLAKTAAESADTGVEGAGDDPKALDRTIDAVLDDIESLTAPAAETPDGDADT